MLTIDLHGLNRQEAQRKVEESLQNAAAYGEKVIRIIHGQGKHSDGFPVLKSWVRHWLREEMGAGLNSFHIYPGEAGSPYTKPNPGETVLVWRDGEQQSGGFEWEAEEEEREARDNAKGMRAERLRKLRRRGYK